MASRLLLLSASVVLLTILAPAQTAVAQETVCGTECDEDCGWFSEEGEQHGPDGTLDMECFMGNNCEETCVPSALVAAEVPGASEILAAVTAAPLENLGAVVERFRERLVLHDSRSLLTVRGTQCNSEAMTSAVVFLSPERTSALEALQVTSLETYLNLTAATN